jgi:hypothetical protein
LLANEVKFWEASTGASKNSNQSKNISVDLSTKGKNAVVDNNWIPVKSGLSNTIKCKYMQQSTNLITLTNRFEVLGNLYDSSDKDSINIPKAHKTSCV